jgi:hypothetical protein
MFKSLEELPMKKSRQRLQKLESQACTTDDSKQWERIRQWRFALWDDVPTLDALRSAVAAGDNDRADKIFREFVVSYEAKCVAENPDHEVAIIVDN